MYENEFYTEQLHYIYLYIIIIILNHSHGHTYISHKFDRFFFSKSQYESF